jgi:hypothetical protein
MATLAESEMTFAHLPHPAPLAADARAAVLADPGFGKVFSDHMVSIDWDEERGWHSASVIPYGPIPINPAAAVLHYAQEIFEGLKAYRLADGGIALFRPEANAARFNASARRLAMPELPEALFVQAVKEMVLADRDWFPTVEAVAVPAPVHVRIGSLPRRAPVQAVQVPGDRLASRQLLQVGRAGGVHLGERLYARRTGRHRRGQVRWQLRRQPCPHRRSLRTRP